MASIQVKTNEVGGFTTIIANTLTEAMQLQSTGVIDRFQFLILQRDLAAEGANLFAPMPGDQLLSGGTGITGGVADSGFNLLLTEPGRDLRDDPGFSPGPSGGLPAIIGITALVRLLAPSLATRALPVIRQSAPGATIFWSRLPSWLQTALVSVGATLGLDLLMDLPDVFEVIPGGVIGGFGGGNGEHGVHLPHDLSAHIVGTWVANEVVFYRLSDGRLAVQNKKGRWKVWRPKRPIVIMPTGAVDLRTMLRADAVLNKQAKRLAAMLNRRAPRRKASQKAMQSGDPVIVAHGKVV